MEVQPTDHTIFSHILKACSALSFGQGRSVHASLIKQGFDLFTSVGNSVMDFYAKSGALGSAVDVLNSMKTKDSVSWNTVLHGHLDQGAFEEGLNLFIQARVFGFEPNVSTLVLIIQAHHRLRAFHDGQRFHAYLIQSGLLSSISVQNALLGMYTDFGMDYAESLFHEIYEKDAISWSVMIGGYVHWDDAITAQLSFKQMVSDVGIEVDGQTMVSVLKGCATLGDIRVGKLIHGFSVVRGLDYDLFVSNTLVDLYCKCGDIDSAVMAFRGIPYRNIVSWNSLLSGFVHNGKHEEALALFSLMSQSGVTADDVTLVNLLATCKVSRNLHQCKSIHCRVIRGYSQSNDLVVNSLIDAYTKCTQINLSFRLFCQIKRPDIVTWSTMISGLTNCGLPDEAILLYRDMRLSRQNPNPVTILNLIEACALSAEIKRSKWAHAIAIRMGLMGDAVVGTAILHMYAKCGAIEASRRAFDQITTKNVVSWSAIIAAYGLNGFPRKALALLSEMEARGLTPNPVTILSVLSACCHGAGKLDDALGVIKSVPVGMKPGASAWGALLSGCKNYEAGKLVGDAFSHVLELEPSSSAGYLLASNTYAARGSWEDASGIRCLMNERGVKVVAGYSLVHVK
ncbi:Tetratricopeptide repeat (TPR)-like superfamily protein [Striga hermonthica]|uniref:Tetratricopeptide repeat (TPR)-like superfamily protein n=1 Tax=Striga hermonthica TaxID=68872 RepID=A0A9N7NK10_STRHE|nr:Tetratricopeptide repeat (TPR)-like superfamily protein [Striga hermonthica]